MKYKETKYFIIKNLFKFFILNLLKKNIKIKNIKHILVKIKSLF